MDGKRKLRLENRRRRKKMTYVPKFPGLTSQPTILPQRSSPLAEELEYFHQKYAIPDERRVVMEQQCRQLFIALMPQLKRNSFHLRFSEALFPDFQTVEILNSSEINVLLPLEPCRHRVDHLDPGYSSVFIKRPLDEDNEDADGWAHLTDVFKDHLSRDEKYVSPIYVVKVIHTILAAAIDKVIGTTICIDDFDINTRMRNPNKLRVNHSARSNLPSRSGRISYAEKPSPSRVKLESGDERNERISFVVEDFPADNHSSRTRLDNSKLFHQISQTVNTHFDAEGDGNFKESSNIVPRLHIEQKEDHHTSDFQMRTEKKEMAVFLEVSNQSNKVGHIDFPDLDKSDGNRLLAPGIKVHEPPPCTTVIVNSKASSAGENLDNFSDFTRSYDTVDEIGLSDFKIGKTKGAQIHLTYKGLIINVIPAIPIVDEMGKQGFLITKPFAYDSLPKSHKRWRHCHLMRERKLFQAMKFADRGMRMKAVEIFFGLTNIDAALIDISPQIIKSAMLHSFDGEIDETPRWQREDLENIFFTVFRQIFDNIGSKNSPSFFERGHNLISGMETHKHIRTRSRLSLLLNSSGALMRALKGKEIFRCEEDSD